jgi:hypothetical protein
MSSTSRNLAMVGRREMIDSASSDLPLTHDFAERMKKTRRAFSSKSWTPEWSQSAAHQRMAGGAFPGL